MKTRILPILGLVLIGLAACGDGSAPGNSNETAATPPPAATPAPATTTVITTEDLARIGASIYLSPEDKDAILAEAEMTEETFTALVEEISQDAEAAYRYAQAFEIELTRP